MTDVMRPVSWAERYATIDAALRQLAGWQAEIKWDGLRALVVVTPQKVELVGRSGRKLTDAFPDVVDTLGVSPTGVWDGELITGVGQGADFTTVNRRGNTTSARRVRELAVQHPATFMPFDCLSIGSRDLRHEPLRTRRRYVEMPMEPASPIDLWPVAQQLGFEGIVVKRPEAPYVEGRSQHWVKVRRTRRITACVYDTDPGDGSHSDTFGALCVALQRGDGGLQPVGKVGSGFTERDRVVIAAALHRRRTVLVEVEHAGLIDGQLRFPVFKGVRTDTDDFSYAQVEEAP